MSIEALKEELSTLDDKSRRHIIAYLVSLEAQADPDYKTGLAAKIDDKDPAHWVSLEELDRRIAETPEG